MTSNKPDVPTRRVRKGILYRTPGSTASATANSCAVLPRAWLDREDFAPFVHCGPGPATIDWDAAITALDVGELPSSGGETKNAPRFAADLASQAPVSLGNAITGIGDRNTDLLVKAILHASERRQFAR